jgi:hypothetical protein
MTIPQLAKIEQVFPGAHVQDIEAEVKKEIAESGVRIRPGQNIALAVGSRGIANIARVVKATAEAVKEMGGHPFIVPAMGSHGGATAEGQRALLEGYGVTEEYTGAPIFSSMRTVELPRGDLCHRLYMDQYAWESDGVIVINRVKVHTDFHGVTESGMLKMCVIGLGKHRQALEMHSFGVYGLRELIPIAARQVLSTGKVMLGIGLVENAYDQTMKIKAALPENIEEQEIRLLNLCRQSMPSLPADQMDLLIVDEMGKDISGVGIDPNITGRMRIIGEVEPDAPKIMSIVVTDLTEASHGNALGMGLADFITARFLQKIDFKATYENVVTSTFVERGKMPMVGETDRIAVEYALRTCGQPDLSKARIMRIKNTLHLGEVYASANLLEEIRARDNVVSVGEPEELFDGSVLRPF